MKPAIVIPAHVANATTYYQLRLCVESVLREIPRSDYTRIFVIDDHSPFAGPYAEWRDHYAGDERISFMLLGEPLPGYYGPNGRGEGEQGRPTSAGHGGALHAAAMQLRERGVRVIFTLDSDCLILNGSCLREAMVVLTQDSRARSVGDYEYGRPGDDLAFYDYLIRNGRREPKEFERQGRTNAVCALWDLSDYWQRYDITRGKHAGSTAKVHFMNGGHAHTLVIQGIWEMGYATAFFPFFQHEYVVHFGYGTLGFTREQFNAGIRGMGNAPDSGARYAGGRSGNYYAGYLRLRCSTAEFHEHLRELYEGRPPNDLSAQFDTSLLCRPGDDAPARLPATEPAPTKPAAPAPARAPAPAPRTVHAKARARRGRRSR